MFTTQNPPQPPIVTTLPATNSSPFSALLHGTVNPHGDTASYSFRYRIQYPDGSFGSWGNTFAQDVSGVVDVDVSGLAFFAPAPGSTYQFQLEATNLGGTGTGNLLTFVTPAQPQPTVVTNDADHIASTTSTLHGSINPNLSASFVYFELGSGTNYDIFLYQRNDAAVDLVSYHVEWWDGVNAVPWSSAEVIDNLLSNDGSIQQRQAVIPKGPNGMRMVRLRVTTPP